MLRLALCFLSALAGMGAGPTAAAAQDPQVGSAPAERFIDAPPGFRSACASHAWLCSSGPGAGVSMSQEALATLGAAVNREVNREVEQATDAEIYGVAEKWSLPQAGRGDCEDLALEKMRRLLTHGVPPERLGIAIVLDRRGNNHAVLLLRLDEAHLVLDSLTDRVLQSTKTNYRMLAMQASQDRARWILADGMATAHLSSTAGVRFPPTERSIHAPVEFVGRDR